MSEISSGADAARLRQDDPAEYQRLLTSYHDLFQPEPSNGKPKGPGSILTFDDLTARTGKLVDWFIEELIRETGILLLSSQPKVGKSDLARNLVRAVATGTPFLGRRCKQGKVLWIGLDEPVSHLRARGELLGFPGLPICFVVDKPPTDKKKWLYGLLQEYHPSMVVVDTIARFAEMDNICDYSQILKATKPFVDLRQTEGTTFVLVHHNNSANTVLGGPGWESIADTIMTITRDPENNRRFVKTKQRDGEDMESTALFLDRDTGIISSAEPKELADQRAAEIRILKNVTESGASREELARLIGSLRIGRSAVDALTVAGLLVMRGDGRKRLYYPAADLFTSLQAHKQSLSYTTSNNTLEDVYQAAPAGAYTRASIRERGFPDEPGTNVTDLHRPSPTITEDTGDTEDTGFTEEEVDLLEAYAPKEDW